VHQARAARNTLRTRNVIDRLAKAPEDSLPRGFRLARTDDDENAPNLANDRRCAHYSRNLTMPARKSPASTEAGLVRVASFGVSRL